MLLGPVNEVRRDQKVAVEAQVVDGLDLVFQALPQFLVAFRPLLPITLLETLKALLADVGLPAHPSRSFKVGILLRAGRIQTERHIAALCDLKGVVAGFRDILENLPHLLRTLEVDLRRVAHPFLIKDELARPDADHHVVGLMIVP